MTGREEIDIKNEAWIQGKLETQPQILIDYMMNIEQSKTSWSRRNYLGYLLQFFDFLKMNGYDVDDNKTWAIIKPLAIKKYLSFISYRIVNNQKVKNKAGIQAAKLFAVSDFFNFLVQNDYTDKNPCKYVETPKDKEEKEIVFLTKDEVRTIQDNIKDRGKYRGKKYNTRDLCIVSLGITTGLRVSAIAEINIEDINFDNHTIMVTEKGNIRRTVYIGNKTSDLLKCWLHDRNKILRGSCDTNAVFISKNRTRISTVAIRDMLRKETYNIDKHITPHKMRSTCATNLYDATGDIYMVQSQLGHANIANTRRYAKVSSEKMEHAANIMDSMF